MNNNTVNVNTTQPAPWVALARKAASVEGVEWSAFVGAAMVDRSISVLGLNHVETWASLPGRGRGRPVQYDVEKAPKAKRKRGRANG
jgi:hypothetical protein